MCWMVLIVSVGCALFMFLTWLQGVRVQKKFEADHVNDGVYDKSSITSYDGRENMSFDG